VEKMMKRSIMLSLILISVCFLSCYDGLLDTYDSGLYELRDRGPAGGWIFYINPNYKEDGWRYLEAAPEDQGTNIKWSPDSVAIGVSAQGVDVGTGAANTSAIVDHYGGADCAAKVCRDYRGGGYDDWFLPSRDELELMYSTLDGTISLSFFCWSSTEVDANNAWWYNRALGMEANEKSTATAVRAVRAF
jgi:hypothetical protein